MLENAGGRIVAIVLPEHVLLGVVKDQLSIPTEEPEPLRVFTPTIDGIPVMMGPVGVTGILVDEHIVDERIDVEQLLQCFITFGTRGLGSRHHQLVPGIQTTLAGLDVITAVLLDLNHVDIALATTQMGLAILVVDTLGHIIKTPVHAVQEEVHVEGVHTRATQFPLHAARPDVAGVLRFLTVPL